MARPHRARLLREPLLQFLLLGAAAWGLWAALVPDPLETIVVEPGTLRALEAARLEVSGRPLSADERSAIPASHVEEQVLVREARRLGLDRSDSRVRERLLALMRASLDEPLPDPGRAELEAYFEEHVSRYWPGERLRFEHLTFPEASSAGPEDPVALLRTLERGEYAPPADPLLAVPETRTATPADLERVLGPEVATRVLALPVEAWGGPFDSRGTHFVRTLERLAVPRPSFEDMLGYVRADWEADRRRSIREAKATEMFARYRVVLPPGEPE